MLLTLLRRTGALILGLLAALLIAEGCVRAGGPIPGEDLYYGGPIPAPVGMHVWSKNTAVENTPGFTATMKALGFEVPIRFNSLGLRGGEVPTGKKWMAIGDSFTLSVQVREEETWVNRLSERMGVPIMNAGVNAYSTVQAARRYAELAEEVDPDVVLLTFFLGNDLKDNERAEQILAQPEQDYSKPPPGTHDRRWLTFLHTYSYLAAYIHVSLNRSEALASANTSRTREDLSLWSYQGQPRLDNLLTHTREALTELRDEAARRGDRLILSLAPPSYAVDPAQLGQLLTEYHLPTAGSDAPRTAVAGLAAELGMEVCDLYPSLRASHEAGRRAYLRYDGHWNRVGHRVVADALAECLKKKLR